MTLTADRAPYEQAATEHAYPVDRLISHAVEPRRRRRRQRTVHRVQWGLGLAALLVAATTFSALPVADGIRTQTLELLSIAEPEPEPIAQPQLEPVVAESGEVADQPELVFDSSVWVDPAMVGVAPPSPIPGILTFRGSPTRTFYGTGPVPDEPAIRWRYPAEGGLCRQSTVGTETSLWCGTGWTGQPAIFERGDRTWAVFGAFDGAVHFVDVATGAAILPPFQTGDIIKGSVTIDPEGHPIVYVGSRDNEFRAIAFDGDRPRELWSLDSESIRPRLWNNDWDGSPLVIGDHLFIGGENSRIHIVRLERTYDADGFVDLNAELIWHAAGWDDELLGVAGENVSIENSVTITGDTLYFANSGGLIQGWDIADLRSGVPPERVFRFWAGDDIDATLVADEDGMLYVGVEFERNNARSRQLGQLLKIDPTKDGDDAVVWSVQENQGRNTGIWGTPALWNDLVIFGSEGGRLRAVDRETGADRWSIGLGFHLWQSPVVVDDTLLMGNCSGVMRAFDLDRGGGEPTERWAIRLDDGCIESTPAVWNGSIVVGTRAGGVYAIGEG